jgi:hypothetical protein
MNMDFNELKLEDETADLMIYTRQLEQINNESYKSVLVVNTKYMKNVTWK